jgi:iron(III) transport system permease protein
MALYSFPFVFSMIANVCELISSDLEDAAEIIGREQMAHGLDRHPALGAAGADRRLHPGFSQSLSLFRRASDSRPARGLHTITTQIWTLFQYPPRLDMAAAFSVPLLLATMLLLAVQKKFSGVKATARWAAKADRNV